MLKETENALVESLEFLGQDDPFKSNNSIAAKCYGIIFSFETLMLYINVLGIDVKDDSTYFEKLKLIKRRIDSKLSVRELRYMKNVRNNLAHNVGFTIVFFKDETAGKTVLDKVYKNISIMIKECEEFHKNTNEDIVKSTRTKIPDIEKSNLF